MQLFLLLIDHSSSTQDTVTSYATRTRNVQEEIRRMDERRRNREEATARQRQERLVQEEARLAREREHANVNTRRGRQSSRPVIIEEEPEDYNPRVDASINPENTYPFHSTPYGGLPRTYGNRPRPSATGIPEHIRRMPRDTGLADIMGGGAPPAPPRPPRNQFNVPSSHGSREEPPHQESTPSHVSAPSEHNAPTAGTTSRSRRTEPEIGGGGSIDLLRYSYFESSMESLYVHTAA